MANNGTELFVQRGPGSGAIVPLNSQAQLALIVEGLTNQTKTVGQSAVERFLGVGGRTVPHPRAFIITGIKTKSSVIKSLQPTVSNDVWFYVFGDDVDYFSLTGLLFTTTCSQGADTGEASGIDSVLNWYASNRASAKREPVVITAGKSKRTFKGFLIDLQIDGQIQGNQAMPALRFNMTLVGSWA